MIPIKTSQEVKIMERGGKILANSLFEVLQYAKPGVSELELDKLAEELILKQGGEPGFKRVEGYKHTICISTNDVVVHGVPTNYRLKNGDIVGIDCGVFLDGFHTDMSETIKIKDTPNPQGFQRQEGLVISDEIDRFLDTGKKALDLAIAQVKPGNHIGQISKTIQMIVEGGGYSVVRELIGHGVGRELHEDPEVPGYFSGKIENTPRLKEGMVIAVEIIYNLGRKEVVYSGSDDWTIKTKDRSLSGLFERTVAVTRESHKVLTA